MSIDNFVLLQTLTSASPGSPGSSIDITNPIPVIFSALIMSIPSITIPYAVPTKKSRSYGENVIGSTG